MSLELPPVQNLLRQLENRNRTLLASVSEIADSRIERTVEALVRDVAPVTETQRQVLLTEPRSTALDANLKQLLQSPELWLAELELDDPKEGKQPLLTVIDQPLRTGDKLVMALVRNQWRGLSNAAQTEPTGRAAGIERNQLDAISTTLRAALPRHEPLSPLLKLVDAIVTATKLLPQTKPSQEHLLALPLRRVLNALVATAKTPQQLSNPRQLKQSLDNSGVLFEHKLRRVLDIVRRQLTSASDTKTADLGRKSAGLLSSNRATSPSQTVTLKTLADIARHAMQRNRPNSNTIGARTMATKTAGAPDRSNNPNPKADSLELENDIKSLLLQAKATLEQDSKINLLPNIAPPTASSPSLVKAVVSDHVDKLIEQLLAHPNSRSADKAQATAVKDTVLQTVYRQILVGLARIQLHQASSLNHSLNNADTNAPAPQQLHFELPIKVGDEFHQLLLTLEEDWVEKSSDNDNERKKVPQWSVTLDFDLQEAGEFYARVRVIDDHVNIQFWAEQSTTLKAAQDKLAVLQTELHSKGVVVDDIQCLPGEPPRRKFNLDYTLVDVRT